jgi:ERCC4-type nuclease
VFGVARYLEQKQRLLASGLDRVMYLVEGALNEQDSLDPKTLCTAMANTQVGACVPRPEPQERRWTFDARCVGGVLRQVQQGFAILQPESLDQTLSLLCRMHRMIDANFRRLQEQVRGPDADSWVPEK